LKRKGDDATIKVSIKGQGAFLIQKASFVGLLFKAIFPINGMISSGG